MDKLKSLLKERDQIDKVMNKLETKHDKLQKQIDELEFGLKIGQDIIYDKHGKKIKCKIESFKSGLWAVARPYKKDGTLSKYRIDCYNLKDKKPQIV